MEWWYDADGNPIKPKVPFIDINKLEDDGVFNYGKHKGDTVTEVALHDGGYLRWVVENIEDLSNAAQELIEKAQERAKMILFPTLRNLEEDDEEVIDAFSEFLGHRAKDYAKWPKATPESTQFAMERSALLQIAPAKPSEDTWKQALQLIAEQVEAAFKKKESK